MNKISGIYCLICHANGSFYVGSSKDILRRKKTHFKLLRKHKHHCQHLQNSYDLYGESAFFIIICEPCDEAELITQEQKYLDVAKQYRGNLCLNSSFIAGKVEHTPEIKLKMSKNHSDVCGINNPMFGKSHSLTTKAAISKFWKKKFKDGYIHPNQGKSMSETQKLKISQTRHIKNIGKGINHPQFGKPMLESTKQKIRKSRARFIGNKHPRFDHNIYQFQNKITNERFEGYKFDFIKKYGLNYGHICQLVKGKCQSVKKWTLIKNHNVA